MGFEDVWVMPDCVCPYCNMKISAATNADSSRPPKAGDLTICFVCANWLIFTDDMKVRKATQEDIDELPPDFVELLNKHTKLLIEFHKRHFIR